ncbi:MAG: UxaA family hydrolase [Pseudomonadota bacterium]
MSDADSNGDFFHGYVRKSGMPGVRNHPLIISLSGLEYVVARNLSAQFPDAELVSTMYGRGHVGEDLRFQRHMMTALGTHPNVGGVLVLAPDRMMAKEVSNAVAKSGREAHSISLDDVGEDAAEMFERASRMLPELISQLSTQEPVPCPISQLAVAVECGHSGASSGIVANPLVGEFAKYLVGRGGRVLFSETLEWTGAEDVLASRAITSEIADKINQAIKRRQQIAISNGHRIGDGNPGPQNHAGGITTLVEKSLGAIAKGGDQSIMGLLGEGDSLPDDAGLYLMDTPCFSPESITSMIASGAQMVLFTTDQGNPYSSAIAPTIKLSANPVAAKLVNQTDFDASKAFTGHVTLKSLLPDLSELVCAIASGRRTKAELANFGAEAISRLGPSI